MPTKTFENLPEHKRAVICKGLLKEFSQHDLADAQVARIVKTTGIARGAFYKYFANLTDAYQYLYQKAVVELHDYAVRSHQLLTADDYTNQAAAFLEQVHNGEYYELVKRHFTVNENLLNAQQLPQLRPVSATEWAVMTLVHEAIKEGLQHPEQKAVVLDRLKASLGSLLAKGD